MLTSILSTDNPPQDPALTANTFIQNRTLANALTRLAARASAPVIEIPPAPAPTDTELDEQYLLLAGWERHATAFGVVYLDPYLYGEHTLNHALLVQEGRDVAAHASTYADGPEAAE